MSANALTRLRRLCLALPGATEVETWGDPTFRIAGKIFAKVGTQDGGPAVWLKAPPGAQAFLVELDPARFFRPPYLGGRGWLGVVLTGTVDWPAMEDLVQRSFTLVAPKKATRTLPRRAS